MGKYIDLHAHTTCSDGTFTPTEMVEEAAKIGLEAVAITDHDTVEGIPEALDAGKRFGIRLVPGLELSTKYENKSVHIVGLFPDTSSEALQDMMREIVRSRIERNQLIFGKLADLGYPLEPEPSYLDGSIVVTRGLVGQMLVDAGYFRNIQETFDVLLERDKPAYVPKWSPGSVEGIKRLHEAGALAIVAHYHKIYKSDLDASRRVVEELLQAGADGLEVRYSDFHYDQQRIAEELAEKYGCLRSGGSDFHGKLKPGLRLGTGYGYLKVPYAYLEEIDAFRARKKLSAAEETEARTEGWHVDNYRPLW